MTKLDSAQLSIGHRASIRTWSAIIPGSFNKLTRSSNHWTPNLAILTRQTFDCFKVYQKTKHLSKTQKLDFLEGDQSSRRPDVRFFWKTEEATLYLLYWHLPVLSFQPYSLGCPKKHHMAIYFGHMAIGPYATNMGKWGIPGQSYKNVAQQC